MKISAILACDLYGTIGQYGKLPWKMPSDLRRFKEVTYRKAVIMGRKTFESLKNPLVGRVNIVLSSSKLSFGGAVLKAYSIEDAINLAKGCGSEELCVIGGSSVYHQMVYYVETLFLSVIKCKVWGSSLDSLTPRFLFHCGWKVKVETDWLQSCRDQYPVKFFTCERD